MLLTDQQNEALKLYLAATPILQISKKVGVARTTVTNWVEKFNWQAQAQHKPVHQQVLDRIQVLLPVLDKTKTQLQELEMLLSASSDDYAKRISPKAHAQGQTKVTKGRNGKAKKSKNDFEGVTQLDFDAKFKTLLLPYQAQWREAKIKHAKGEDNMPRTRAILKSRQIGATWYFAAEAFEDAVLTGDNQIFLSASQNQSNVFRTYIRAFAKDWFGVELRGTDQIELANGAVLYFLATSARTAQSYHGHVYIDEFFWMPHFTELNKVATAMASHKRWRKTYFSTPSALSHDAYSLWSGERMKSKSDKEDIITTHKHLVNGAVGSDRIWRMMTTVKDAQELGCNFFDINELKDEYTKADFDNLFMCKFVDDADSIFKLSKLQKSVVDISTWRDYHPDKDRPLGNAPVWIGYDPARSRDDASVVVVAPPLKAGGKFRVLEKHRWRGQTFEFQALQIKSITERFNVTEIAMDTSGIGWGAYERVQMFYPAVTALTYTPTFKERMVAKMLDVINSNRIEFAQDNQDILYSFMAIGRTATGSGKIVINANRSASIGHADVAFAIMHAVYQEPSDHQQLNQKSAWSEL